MPAYKTRQPGDGQQMRAVAGAGRPWPIYLGDWEPEEDWWLLTGGELDALRARSAGLPAVSMPLGVSNWRDEWADALRGRRVVVCFDVGEEKFAEARADEAPGRARRWRPPAVVAAPVRHPATEEVGPVRLPEPERRRGRRSPAPPGEEGLMSPPKKRPKRAQDPLLADIVTFIRRFVVLTDEQTLVVALWVLHTHLITEIEQTPYLSITSPESECGESRLFETLELLAARAWMVVSPSDAVAYRQIDSNTPTLLLDEVDTIFGTSARFHEGLRAILDAGHRGGAKVPRAADFGKSVEHFSPYCAKAFAGIGALPDTIARRSIYIRLARKRSTDHVERFIRRDVLPDAVPLRSGSRSGRRSTARPSGALGLTCRRNSATA